jgi:hypothetical protein|tara:strand:+ start:199 stop:414 length:216 start_codon:yes stop_codon:yes gene_type:complete
MDAKRMKVEQLLSEKRKIDIQINELQHKCKHEQQVIKQVADESSTMIRYVCESCGLILGWPSKQQIEDFLK